MRFLPLVFGMFFLTTTLSARSNYCIQVTEVYNFNKHHIPNKISKILNNFDKARIDERSGILVLRVGDYRDYRGAKRDLNKIQDSYFDAYIRKCDYDSSRVIYEYKSRSTMQDNTEENYGYSSSYENDANNYQRESYSSRRVDTRPKYEDNYNARRDYENNNYQDDNYQYETIEQPRNNYNKRKKSTKKPEYKGQDRENYDLYRECQKCFAPMNFESLKDTDNEDTEQRYGTQRRTKDLYKDDIDDYDDYQEYKQPNESRKRVKKIKKRVKDKKEESGFFDFLKKPQYKDKKEEPLEEDIEDKAGFFDYLKTNKYKDKEEPRNIKSKKENGIFGYFKRNDKIDDESDEYTPRKKSIENNNDDVYDMYNLDEKESSYKKQDRYSRDRNYKDTNKEIRKKHYTQRRRENNNYDDDY